MAVWILLVASFARECRIDCCGRDPVLLRQTVSQDCRGAPVEEVENSIIDVLQSDPQFIDTFMQKVRFWPAQFVPEFR
jgi:hypothetical protein